MSSICIALVNSTMTYSDACFDPKNIHVMENLDLLSVTRDINANILKSPISG